MLSAASEVITGQEISALIISWRPVAVVLFPILASMFLFLVGPKLKKAAGFVAAAAGMITFLLVLSLYPLLRQGIIEYRYSELMSMGLLFRVDYLSFIFAFLVSFCWMGVLFYAVSYMTIEERPLRYFSFALLTLGSCLGVVLTGDLLSLFLFFELMTFSSYVLVIGRMNREAFSAGLFTLYMGVAGGLVLLFGIFLLYSAAGTVELKPLMDLLTNSEISPTLIFTCFFIGFGIKAGVVPLHLWMPRAYSASPVVVNALSSGAMIKAGIYGIIRILMLVLTPASLETAGLFSFAISTGYVVMWLGLLTMVAGAVMALMQGNILRLLAYSSISQVGYIVTGIGAGAYLFGAEEAMGYSGAVLHSFNHTLFKTAFFLIVGIIVYKTGELEIKKLGGLARKLPLLTGFFILFVLAIAGIPGFNGYISKTLIHDALLEAHHHFGGFHLYFAEKVFMLGSALTLCYYLKFFQGVFLGQGEGSGEKQERNVPWLLYVPLFVFALFILAVGIYPNFFIEEFVLASTNVFTFEPYSIKHIVGFRFFDSHPLEASFLVLLLGLALYLPLNKWKIYDRKFPRWMSIEYLIFAPLSSLILKLMCRFGVSMDGSVNNFYLGLGGSFLTVCRYVGYFDSGLDHFYETSSHSALDMAKKTKRFDDALNAAYEKTSHGARDLADRTTRFDGALNKAYEKTGDTARRMADRTTKFDEALDKTYENTGKAAMRLADRTGQLDRALDQGYEKAGSSTKEFIEKSMKGEGKKQTEDPETPQQNAKRPGYNPLEWNIRNINFDSLLLALMLGLVIFILFYFARDL
jgi:hydrogenase-4 component B